MSHLDLLPNRLAVFEPAAMPVLSLYLVDALEHVVRLARTTDAHVSFIEDPSLLDGVGGVGAMLRHRL